MMKTFAATVAIALTAAALPALAQQAAKPQAAPAAAKAATEDRYIGYYYPKPTSTEVFESQLQTIAGVERAQRIQFTTVVSQGTIQSAYRVPYAVFAKGEKADKMIIVGMQQGEHITGMLGWTGDNGDPDNFFFLHGCAAARPHGGERDCVRFAAMDMTANFTGGVEAAGLCTTMSRENRSACFAAVGTIMGRFHATDAERASACAEVAGVDADVEACTRGARGAVPSGVGR